MSIVPPFPPSGGYLHAIRQTSKDLRIASGISITHESVKRMLFSEAFIQTYQRVSKNHGLALPLNFSSPLDELNLISILSLLNFASGYRVPLHTQTGRGAWDSIRALTFSMYITSTSGDGDLLSAKGLKTINVLKIAEFMGINLHIERPHDTIPGVIVGELGGPLYELVKLIASTLNETGQILLNNGYANLGSFVAEALKESAKAPDSQAALEVVLEKLARAFPGFRDMSEVNGQPIYCFKKALFLIHAITIRFGSLSPAPFPIPTTINTPVFSDNVLPSLLIHLGVIDISANPTLASLFPAAGLAENLTSLLGPPPSANPVKPPPGPKPVPKEGPLITDDQAYILRAAAIDACEIIVETAHALEGAQITDWIPKITLPDLDMWIWAVAKDRPDYRALGRFAAQDTIYF